jgi:hypothetical protein
MTAIPTDPVLAGALQSALSYTRDAVFDTAGTASGGTTTD